MRDDEVAQLLCEGAEERHIDGWWWCWWLRHAVGISMALFHISGEILTRSCSALALEPLFMFVMVLLCVCVYVCVLVCDGGQDYEGRK